MSVLESITLFWALPSLCLLLPLTYLVMYVEDKDFEDVFDIWVVASAAVLPLGLTCLVILSFASIRKFLNIKAGAIKKLLFKKISFKTKEEN